METPVIYFYADEEQTVDVAVDFPKGLITEWYPQARQIGPSTVPAPRAVVQLDNYAHKAGVNPAFTFTSFLRDGSVKQSQARWTHVEILPGKQNPDLSRCLPLDRSGSHYFAARETDAAFLRVNSMAKSNPSPEVEKFIFYRGVGSFATPLRVTMASSSAVTVENTGPEPLAHLFILGLENRAGKFIYIDRLSPGEQRAVQMDLRNSSLPLEKLSHQLGERMAASLVSEGLYHREATAMVDTWKDSWFAEDGLRVLYVLPRAWTDRTLPLTLDPAPRQLVRVMVGRAEVISSAQQHTLALALAKAAAGDAAARAQALAEFKKLGRFAEPAMRLATKDANQETTNIGWALLQAAASPSTETTSL